MTNNKDQRYLASSDTICVSMTKLKKKYYDAKIEKIDIQRVQSDITKIDLDIAALQESSLYYYDKSTNKYIKVFDDLKTDYLHILHVKRKGLANFLKLVTYDHIVIPESFKKKYRKTEEP